VTLVDLRALTKTLATWLASATSLVFAFSRFLPSGRLRGYSFVDDSWIQMLHTAFAERLQFGRGRRVYVRRVGFPLLRISSGDVFDFSLRVGCSRRLYPAISLWENHRDAL
jgi:hypothetical protein